MQEGRGEGKGDARLRRFEHEKPTGTKVNRGKVSKGHATVTPPCSTYRFFHSHSVSVHRHPSLTSNVSRRGVFFATPMHGHSRYVNYRAFTDDFLTPTPCFPALACPRHCHPRHPRVRNQHPRVRVQHPHVCPRYRYPRHPSVCVQHPRVHPRQLMLTRAGQMPRASTHMWGNASRCRRCGIIERGCRHRVQVERAGERRWGRALLMLNASSLA